MFVTILSAGSVVLCGIILYRYHHLIWTEERRVWAHNGEFLVLIAMIRGMETKPVYWAALHVWFLHLTKTSNCLKDGQRLDCFFCSQD